MKIKQESRKYNTPHYHDGQRINSNTLVSRCYNNSRQMDIKNKTTSQ